MRIREIRIGLRNSCQLDFCERKRKRKEKEKIFILRILLPLRIGNGIGIACAMTATLNFNCDSLYSLFYVEMLQELE